MGKMIDKIKAQEQLSPNEMMAGIIWSQAVLSPGHFFKTKYYDRTMYVEYTHDNNAFTIDLYYYGQEESFMLIQPTYKAVLAVVPSIFEWLDNTYATFGPMEPERPRRSRRGRAPARPQRGNTMMPGVRPQNSQNNGRRQKSS